MSVCVLDASFAFQWLFKDEASPESYAKLGLITDSGAVVPALWFIEITNGLAMAERRARLSVSDIDMALRLLQSLPLSVDQAASLVWSHAILDLMREYRLTAYDATYLELAHRLGLPLATKDKELAAAAAAMGVPSFGA